MENSQKYDCLDNFKLIFFFHCVKTTSWIRLFNKLRLRTIASLLGEREPWRMRLGARTKIVGIKLVRWFAICYRNANDITHRYMCGTTHMNVKCTHFSFNLYFCVVYSEQVRAHHLHSYFVNCHFPRIIEFPFGSMFVAYTLFVDQNFSFFFLYFS